MIVVDELEAEHQIHLKDGEVLPSLPVLPVASKPNIQVIGEVLVEESPDRDYPLKIRRQLRNDAMDVANVGISRYEGIAVDAKQPWPTAILQLEFERDWHPIPHGSDRIAVLPGQKFRFWIGADEERFNKTQLEKLRGRIGTMVLLVNGEPVNVQL
jgi:hypothetical protein